MTTYTTHDNTNRRKFDQANDITHKNSIDTENS